MKSTVKGGIGIVTGAAKRIGRALAVGLARAGADVVVHYNRSEKEAGETCRLVEAEGAAALAVQADLSDPDETAALFSAAVEKAGPIDILINSAADFPEQTLSAAGREEFKKSMDLIALTPLHLSRAFAAQGIPGNIINILDARITDYDRKHVPYHLAKRALADLTRMMSLEFAPGIRVNGVAPGLILPPPGKDDEYLRSLAGTNPLRTVGTPDQIVDSVLFLLGNEFITGQIIYVDGGRHMKGNVYGY